MKPNACLPAKGLAPHMPCAITVKFPRMMFENWA